MRRNADKRELRPLVVRSTVALTEEQPGSAVLQINVLNRRIHYWASAAVALPLLVIIGSGLLLQMKKQVDWVQPSEQRGAGVVPVISFDRILESVRRVAHLGVMSWDDVNRMDVRPDRGMVKVWLRSGY